MYILSDKIVITRKKHKCSACGRVFEPGTKMRTIVNTYEEFCVWRECPTCMVLLDEYSLFFEDYDGVRYEHCVAEVCNLGQTPEDLLIELKTQ